MSSSVGGESHQIPMQDASTIILESVMSILAFYATFHTLAKYTTSLEFRQNWQIGNAVALDIANKSISALFATISSLTGTYVLITYGTEDYSSQVITIFMPMAIGYFLYDMGAMCQVHLARLDEKSEKDSKNQENPKDRSFFGFLSTHPLMSVHHLALSLFFVPLMINRRDHYPGDPMLACALLMEASTPFVSFRAILYNLHLRHSFIYVFNGLFMVFVFFSCRILIYPWFYQVHSLATGVTFTQAVMNTPPRCATYMVLALLPQLYWFKIMFSGALKVLLEKIHGTTNNKNNPNNNHVIKSE